MAFDQEIRLVKEMRNRPIATYTYSGDGLRLLMAPEPPWFGMAANTCKGENNMAVTNYLSIDGEVLMESGTTEKERIVYVLDGLGSVVEPSGLMTSASVALTKRLKGPTLWDPEC